MTNIRIIEDEHRNKMINIVNQIPKGIPLDWEYNTLAVGGLMYIGFSEVNAMDIEFRKITEFPRGTLAALLKDSYSFEPHRICFVESYKPARIFRAKNTL